MGLIFLVNYHAPQFEFYCLCDTCGFGVGLKWSYCVGFCWGFGVFWVEKLVDPLYQSRTYNQRNVTVLFETKRVVSLQGERNQSHETSMSVLCTEK